MAVQEDIGVGTSFFNKTLMLANLSIFVWVSILDTLSNWIRTSLLRLIGHVAPDIKLQTGLLVNTYEAMRKQLRDSLKELEYKDHQLEESEAQLRKSRDFLQNIIDSLDDSLMVLDDDLHIVQANRSLYLKHDKETGIVGRYCHEITNNSDNPCHSSFSTCPVSKVWRTDKPALAVHQYSTDEEGLSGDRFIEIRALPIRDTRGKITQVVELMRDITESKEMEKRILEANRRLLALNAIASTVSQSLSLDVILNNALDKALEITGAQAGGIFLLEEKSRTLHCRARRGMSEQLIQKIPTIPLASSMADLVPKQKEAMVFDDISNDSRAAFQSALLEEGLKVFTSVPLKSKERLVGMLNIARRKARSFSEQEEQLLTALGHQLGVAIENAQLYEELKLRDQIRADLLRQVISAQEDERRRVARELHDVTSQALATLGVRLEALTAVPESSTEIVKDRLGEIKSLLAFTSKEVHRLIHDLRPTLLDDIGLPAALRSCIHSVLNPSGVEVHFEVMGEEKRLPPQVEIALFRIVQEAVTNIASHSQAESAYASIEFKNRSVVVQVEDDGKGFDLMKVVGPINTAEAFGLLGMKERATLLGGTLSIDTAPGRGTIVTVEIPVDWGQVNV